MGFVWDTNVNPTQPEPALDVFEVAGTVVYLGPITVPLATNPDFDREVQIENAGGERSTVQYYLPPGIALPVQEGFPYTFWLRRRHGFEGYVAGAVITRPTSGLVPLLFIGDTGSYGRAFFPEDPGMSPLKVYVDPRPECPALPNSGCGGDLLLDQLRFDSSSGGVIMDVQVAQGATADLMVLGNAWRVMNLASTHIDQPCADDPGMLVSYLAVDVAAMPQTCDPSRFYIWDTPHAIDVGTYCDSLIACVDNQDQAAAIESVAPDATCGEPVSTCPGQLGCVWDANILEVDQNIYDQLCAVSVLADPPDRIDCHVYFE